jgi:excisionase family DNA binding protein
MDASHPLVELVELSRTLRLSRRWLKREIAAGRIPYLKAGHKRLFNTNAVRDALAARAAGEAVRDGR